MVRSGGLYLEHMRSYLLESSELGVREPWPDGCCGLQSANGGIRKRMRSEAEIRAEQIKVLRTKNMMYENEDHLPGPSSRLTGLVWGGPMLGSSESGGNVTVIIIIIKILLVINMLSLRLSQPQSSHLRAWREGDE